ncbi:DMT family transporter [Taklimakanibacter deserti]|uniref:DMT family transporter n=1 Tax=Taklimakanibacter deserti TaxID=2267839 RepID=UPI000E64F58C
MSETTAGASEAAAQPLPWLGYAFTALGAALFSSKAIFIKLAYLEKSDAALMLALRMMMSLPFFLAVGLYALYLHRRAGRPYPGWRTVAFTALNGFIGYYVAAYLDFAGLTFITAQLERLVLFTYPVFVMFLGWLFFNGRITLQGVLGAAITYAGLALIFTNGVSLGGGNTAIGSLLVLAAALAFALYQLLAKDLIRTLGSTLFTAIAMSAAGFASLVHYAITSHGVGPAVSWNYMGLVAGCAFFATVLPSFLINAGLGRTSPQAASMISTISPLFTIILAVIFLGEAFTFIDAIGTALIILGVGFYAWSDARAARTPATET